METVRSLESSSSSSSTAAESETAQPLGALFSAARSTGMERWHATTSSDTSANHVAHLPDERYGHAPFPRRPKQRGVDSARTPNLTTERGGQNGRKEITGYLVLIGIDFSYSHMFLWLTILFQVAK